jgi:hypothetical protein
MVTFEILGMPHPNRCACACASPAFLPDWHPSSTAWLPSILFLMTYFLVLFRDGVRDYLLSLNPGVRDFFSSY